MTLPRTSVVHREKMIELGFAILSDEVGLDAESVQLCSDTDSDEACLIASSREFMFKSSSILVVMPSTAMDLPILDQMNVSIGSVKELLKIFFLQTFYTASVGFRSAPPS